MLKKILLFIYVNVIMPGIFCVVLPIWNLQVEQQFQNDLLIGKITNVRNCSQMIVGILLGIMVLIYLKQMDVKETYISLILTIVFLVIWIIVKPIRGLYTYGLRYLMVIGGTNISILIYNITRMRKR